MLLSSFHHPSPPSTTTPIHHHHSSTTTTIFSLHHSIYCHAHLSTTTSPTKPLPLTTTSFSSSSSSSSSTYFHHVTSKTSKTKDTNNGKSEGSGQESENMVASASASAIAAAIREVSKSPVEFEESVEKGGGGDSRGLVLPSSEFQRLCVEQLDLFRRIVHPDAILSVYVRPAGSYVMDRLELRRITLYPGVNAADIVILVGNFSVTAGLRAAEAAISSQQAQFLPELGAVVFPLVKHPFIVGFLVAELPNLVAKHEKDKHDVKRWPTQGGSYHLPPTMDLTLTDQSTEDQSIKLSRLTSEQILNAVNISRSLAMAYVMDQKSILLQQSSWQNNIRMTNLVEQIRGSLSSIQTLSKMLSVHTRRNEISYDIVEDIITQGDHIRVTLQQLQDVLYLTKTNIMRYNEDSLKKINQKAGTELMQSQFSENFSMESSTAIKESSAGSSLTSVIKDLEMPMPPLALAPIHLQGIRKPCNVCNVLADMVGAVRPLAKQQQQIVELCELSSSLEVAVEEPALRQALSNLIEGAMLRTQVGGKVEIVSTGAPAGGALIIIDDDGPDMHYMTQMHSLTPFGTDLFSQERVEDNMTWNFVAGLTVAREILESYGCVVRIISPRKTNAATGAGGTRVELWLPSFSTSTDMGRLA
ncbi:hypothetical protein LIER_28110 [Lithospermum erythrorhizon]|uniref:Histidine kinase/HSP90-like ATPase domain-containing protein n=1 Tax=Lithospermum erythrorhizon TaxID=34254 RepID=A0AAV3RES3_LITER